MGIRKTDLYKFVEDKIKALRSPIWKSVETALKAEFFPVIAGMYPEADALERSAQRFHDELELFISKHIRFDKWKYSNVVRDVNTNVIGLRDGLAAQYAGWATWNVLGGATNGLMPEMDALIPTFKEKYAEEIARYKEIGKLGEELLPIIDGHRNGDKAYKQLQELGVDLTGFDTGTPNLPAVVKLTVDVCLINGNCGQSA